MLYAYDGMSGIYHTISPVLKNPPKFNYSSLWYAGEPNPPAPKGRGRSRKAGVRSPPGFLPFQPRNSGKKYTIHIRYVV